MWGKVMVGVLLLQAGVTLGNKFKVLYKGEGCTRRGLAGLIYLVSD